MFNHVRNSNHLVFFKSIYKPEEESPLPYTQNAIPINIASIITRIRANTKFLYVKSTKLERSSYCDKCNNLVNDDWSHIFRCEKNNDVARKYDINFYKIVEKPDVDRLKCLYNFLSDLVTQ